jgi:acetylglutamate kinase
MPTTVANSLIEALPYVQQWAGQIIVVKLGGAIMADEVMVDHVAKDLVLLSAVGIKVVFVHGGGSTVSAMGKRLGIQPRFVDGLRVTDDETMRIAQLVQVGGISRDILGRIARHGGRGIGLSGHDGGGWIRAQTREHVSRETGEAVDLGRVGDVTGLDASLVMDQIDNGLIPVVAPVAVDDDFAALNVNADTVATALATELKAARLLLLTDVDGIYGPDGLVNQVEAGTVRQWIEDGVITGGMVPKVEAALSAIDSGVGRVTILNGRVQHAMLIELLTDAGSGTLVTE